MYRLNESEKLLDKVYHNAVLGSASANQLLPAAKNNRLSQELKRQKEGYDNIASTAEVYLSMTGKERPAFDFVGGKALRNGIAASLAAGTKNQSRAAELRIKGSATGADAMRSQLKHYPGSESYAKEIADRLIRFEEQNISRIRQI